MDPNTKRYNDFVHAYKKAHPDLQKSVQVDKAQALNDVKNDSKLHSIFFVRGGGGGLPNDYA